MPDWGEILKELAASAGPHGPDNDSVRRKYLGELAAYTKRDTILYATRWISADADASLVSIGEEDIHGFMAVMRGLRSRKLDLILHSPGGSAEAAEAIVTYLRTRFDHIRVIVPMSAMSAATMIACAADEIIMGSHSFLGPIDPQLIGPSGSIAAQAVLDQFELAKQECKDPKLLGAWAPMLARYGPALLMQCKNALRLSEDLVCEWLKTWMFNGRKNAARAARATAKTLANHKEFRSHGRHISIAKAQGMGLNAIALESDTTLQELVLSVFHATTQTFDQKPVGKIIENHLGKAYVKINQQVQFTLPIPIPQLPPSAPPPPPTAQPPVALVGKPSRS